MLTRFPPLKEGITLVRRVGPKNQDCKGRAGCASPTPVEVAAGLRLRKESFKFSATRAVLQIGATLRVFRWIGEWARRDPSEPHWHLGPVAVDPHLQGHGIGDDCAALSYLETDKSENVRFYQKFGFRVTEQATVLGIPNWFMSRPG